MPRKRSRGFGHARKSENSLANQCNRQDGRRTSGRADKKEADDARQYRDDTRCGGERGLPVSRSGLFQDEFLQCQIRHRLMETRVLRLKLLEPLYLVAPAILLVIVSYDRTASAIDRLCASRTSTCRNLATISWGLCLFLAIPNPPSVTKAILQGGSLFRGRPKPVSTCR